MKRKPQDFFLVKHNGLIGSVDIEGKRYIVVFNSEESADKALGDTESYVIHCGPNALKHFLETKQCTVYNEAERRFEDHYFAGAYNADTKHIVLVSEREARS